MAQKRFHLSHSVVGTAGLLLVEGVVLWTYGRVVPGGVFSPLLILLFAALGASVNIYVATEVIREVRSAVHMLALLSAVVAEFVVLFTFQYWFLVSVVPDSYTGLANEPTQLFLHSTMIFVFNPLYLPTNSAARLLLLIHTFGALVLVLFILQNVWQIRKTGEDVD